jgi:cob(I)alamin adenosyltransferase
MAKIYTRTGDTGETSLFGAERARKDDLRVEVIGTVDELNATLGVAVAELLRSDRPVAELAGIVQQLQHRLFSLGADLADPAADAGTCRIRDEHVVELEATIDRYEARLEPLDEFILPGGLPAGAELHLARCICRRAERRLVSLAAQEAVASQAIRYLNRLGDLLFVLARAASRSAGVPDVAWRQDR